MDPEEYGNWIESVLWSCFAVVFLLKAIKARGKLRRLFSLLAAAFFLFGLSDIVESQTGAWWTPWWLLLWKTTCVVILFFGFRAYYQITSAQNGRARDSIEP